MATLRSKHKRFIVRRLAVFDRPKEVQRAVKNRYGIETSRQQLQHYDPTTKNGRKLASKWKGLFERTRREFVEEQKGIAIAYKSKRLRDLEKVKRKLLDKLDDLEEMDHHLGVVDILAEIRDTLEQAAKETGGKYTNRTELTGRDGGPVETMNVDVDPDDADDPQELMEMYRDAFENDPDE